MRYCTLILARHAEREKLGGSDLDDPLSDLGREQGAELRAKLGQEGFVLDLVMASPADRARVEG